MQGVAGWTASVSQLLNVRIIDPGYGIATWDRVLLQLWRTEATLDKAEHWLEIGKAFVAESGGQPCSSLSIVESRSPPPTNPVRLAMAESFRSLAPHMRHQIVVAEGSHFRSALVRGVGLALSTLSPSALPLQFAVSLDEAAVTLAPDLSAMAGGAEGLKAAVSSLRTQIDACTPG